MCATCGCDHDEMVIKDSHFDEDEHLHDHQHDHTHGHDHHHHETVEMEKDVLLKNNLIAERNRGYLEAKNILAFNLVSSPGAGKTSILEKIIPDLLKKFPVYVIEGDQQTTFDAARIEKTGAKTVQVNTGKGCHLEAEMVNQAIKRLRLANNSILLIENVGNLVCPALFDLGETKRIVIYSVPEGDDKPLKYPHIFESSDLCVINKIDLLPYLDFNIRKAKDDALRINHHLEFFETSARDGSGLEFVTNYFLHELEAFQKEIVID